MDKFKMTAVKLAVKPNLFIYFHVIKFTRGIALCEGSGYVNEKLACSAEFNLILPDEVKKYNIKK